LYTEEMICTMTDRLASSILRNDLYNDR